MTAPVGSPPVRFGVNYTPRVGWFHHWLDFSADDVARDLDAVAELEHTPYMKDLIYRVFYAGPALEHDRVSWSEAGAKQLGAALRRLREERRLSQESLAFRAGITKNQLQLIEAGRASGRRDASGPSNPRLSTLVGLAEVLDRPVSRLLADAGL